MSDNGMPDFIRSMLSDLGIDPDTASLLKGEEDEAPVRTWPADTKMDDIPTDLTVEESFALFGTEYDPTTSLLLSVAENLFGMTDEARNGLFHEVQHLVKDGGLPLPGGDMTIEEARKPGMVIDLVTIGLLTHILVTKIKSRKSSVNVEVVDMTNFDPDNPPAGGIFSGKGPFG